MLNAEKLKKIQEFIELSKSSLTEEEFVKNFKIVIDVIKKAKEEMNLAMVELETKYTEIVNSIKENYGGDMQGMKKETTDFCIKEINKMKAQVDAKMAEVQNGLAGKDADEAIIAENASKMAQEALKPFLPTIEAIEADLPKLGGSIASALELLPENEKLEISAIKDLEKKLEELKQLKTQRLGGGSGLSAMAMFQHFVFKETPTGDVNDINKDFVLNHTPSPSNSLTVYVGTGVMHLTEDYTFSNKTISFITAPPTGAIIRVDYLI